MDTENHDDPEHEIVSPEAFDTFFSDPAAVTDLMTKFQEDQNVRYAQERRFEDSAWFQQVQNAIDNELQKDASFPKNGHVLVELEKTTSRGDTIRRRKDFWYRIVQDPEPNPHRTAALFIQERKEDEQGPPSWPEQTQWGIALPR